MSSADDSQQDLYAPSSTHSSEDSQKDLFAYTDRSSSSQSDDGITSFQKPQNVSPDDEYLPSPSPQYLFTELEADTSGPAGITPGSAYITPGSADIIPGPAGITPGSAYITHGPADTRGAANMNKKRRAIPLLGSTRGKKTRKLMNAEPCHSCKGYYRACGLSEEETRKQISKVCRHRTHPGRSKTPPGFWDLEIKGSVPEESPSPPRKRENKYLKKSRLL